MTSTLLGTSPAPGARHSDLASVLDSGAVRSIFQPIVDLGTGEAVAFEALARGPVGPWEPPMTLFAAAREAGLVGRLDRACQAAAVSAAIAHGLTAPAALFVNVEPQTLDVATLSELSALVDSAPHKLRLVLEITERALATRPAELLRTVERVRDLGWGLAFDDVGADNSSLAFLALLRPDVVKLDLRLTQGRASREIAELMHAVNAYAERTGAMVLAEGIETGDHLVRAHALGATLGQGWLFGRPTAAPDVVTPTRPLELPALDRVGAPTPAQSPFEALPVGTVLRRAPKRFLVELSKQLEREAMRIGETCFVAATFQEAVNFTVDTQRRYRDLVDYTNFVCALGEGLPPEPLPGLRGASLDPADPVRGEWDVVVLGPQFSAALLARDLGDQGPDADRMFEYALTYRRETVVAAAVGLVSRVVPQTTPPG